jgi:hypothetical protein
VGWAFFYMFVILKIPIVALLYLVWWAVQEPEPAEPDSRERERLHRGPDHPRRPRKPRTPRRGPHAEPPPAAPSRVRAHAKRIERAHER